MATRQRKRSRSVPARRQASASRLARAVMPAPSRMAPSPPMLGGATRVEAVRPGPTRRRGNLFSPPLPIGNYARQEPPSTGRPAGSPLPIASFTASQARNALLPPALGGWGGLPHARDHLVQGGEV